MFLADNAVWFGTKMAVAANYGLHRDDITLDGAEREILTVLAAPDLRNDLLLSQDDKLGYLATVYVPMRSWYSHWANTPYAATRHAELNAFFDGRGEPPAWRARSLVVILALRKSGAADLHRHMISEGFRDVFANDR